MPAQKIVKKGRCGQDKGLGVVIFTRPKPESNPDLALNAYRTLRVGWLINGEFCWMKPRGWITKHAAVGGGGIY